MKPANAAELLLQARLRNGLSQEALAIRAGLTRSVVAGIECGEVSPTVESLNELLQLAGEDLVLSIARRETGIDLTLNLGNLELSTEQRVEKGLAFADFVRHNRGGGTRDLGPSVDPGRLLRGFDKNEVDFVVIGSVAGLVHGSAYPTYDLDLA